MFDFKRTLDTYYTPLHPKVGDVVDIYLRFYKKSPVGHVFLRIIPDGEEINIPMAKINESDFFVLYHVKIKVKLKKLDYFFLLVSDNEILYYNQMGVYKYRPTLHYAFKILADFESPNWVMDSVFYQIMPDNFENGKEDISVKTGEYSYLGHSPYRLKWDEKRKPYKESFHLDFYGGDLYGIESRMDHFHRLGINALYLTPIFLSPSYHKYDTQDYFLIDPHLGSNEYFSNLVKALHKNGIKIILDGVFNHVGVCHKWFNKCGYYDDGAYRDPDSPYREFFIFYNYPDDYEGWLGVDTLVKLDYRSGRVRDIIYRDKESVAQYWVREPYNIDGWRLDVSNMLARLGDFQGYKEVWREFRKALKDISNDIYIMGENFFDATEYLQGDMLDGVMNYHGFTFPIIELFTGKREIRINGDFDKAIVSNTGHNIYDMLNRMEEVRASIPYQIQLLMYNLLTSHDIPRIISLLPDRESLKSSIALLLSYIGVPSIYFGEEIGLVGRDELENRRAMIWDMNKWDIKLFDFYKKLIDTRKKSRALRYGRYKLLDIDNEFFAFARVFEGEIAVYALNIGEAKTFDIPVWMVGLLNGKMESPIDNVSYNIRDGYISLFIEQNGFILLLN